MRRTLIALVFLAACGKNEQPPPPTSGRPNAPTETGPSATAPSTGSPTAAAAPSGAKAEAQQMFSTLCATCHGADGTGNGPAAASLDPKPRNYTDAEWQASVTDDDLKKIILEGGQAVGKSAMMPGQPQLKDRPEVVSELVAIIRSFAKKS